MSASEQPSKPPPDRGTQPPESGTAPAKQKPGRAFSTGQVLGGILLVLVVIFIVENTESVEIRFIAGPKISMPVYVALLVAAVVGALIAALLRYRRHRHRSPRA